MSLPRIFSDHMVVQRGMNVPLWGRADPGEEVTVKVLTQEKSAVTDPSGIWRLTLDPIESDQPVQITLSAKNTITIDDVLVGEVWLCSGQSNMQMALEAAFNSKQAIASADRPEIRFFETPMAYPDSPQTDVKGGRWVVCTPRSARRFSAAAYYFGVELQEKLNVPVGLIEADLGSSRAEAWLPRQAFDDLKLPYEPAWTKEKTTPKPNAPAWRAPSQAPAGLYNGMIHPWTAYPIRGVAWYQGESNSPFGEHYHQVLAALIKSWRAAWNQGDFPFLVVQIANYRIAEDPTLDDMREVGRWPAVREGQAKVARELPNVGLAVTVDIGESKNIHPRNKADVGHRLALCARKLAYGEPIECSGPAFKSLQIDGDKAIVSFDHAEGLKNRGQTVEGFELAGEDGRFLPAKAELDANRVVLHAQGISAPVSARYGWADDPVCTLYNGADLPAIPFRARR